MTNDIVKKLLEVEKRANDIISEADSRKEHIEDEINSEIAKMDKSYAEKANSRVQKVMDFEKQLALEKVQNLQESTKKSMQKIEETYKNNKDKWLDELYKKVIG